MSSSIKNVYQFRTTSKITQAQGASSTFTIGNDIFTNSSVTITAGSVKLENRTGSQVELFTITTTGGTSTIANRGILPDGTTSTDYQYERPRNTLCTVTVLENQLTNKNDTNTFTETQTFAKDITFTGTSNPGIRPRGMTTAQMNALDMTGINSAIIYNTTANEHYQYIGGSWSAVSSGSTQPNASDTVAGKVEISTQAEFDAGTDTGGTGALVVATNDQIRKQINTATSKTTPVNADSIGIADSAASGVIKKTTLTELKAASDMQATTTTSGFVELATDAEATTGTDQTRYINSKQLKDRSFNDFLTVSENLKSSADTQVLANPGSTRTKYKEIRINCFGAVRVKFEVRGRDIGGYGSTRCQVYINGSAVGIEGTGATPTVWETAVSQDFTVKANDLVQLYMYTGNTGGGNGGLRNFRIYYDVTKIENSTVIQN